MGYTTEFAGKFNLNKELDKNTFNLIKGLAETRRMKRDVNKLKEMGFDGDYGIDGEFFIKEDDCYGQSNDKSIIDHNRPPITQPGLWLQWIPTEDKMGLKWDGNEKFYNSVSWMKYLIDKILEPKGYVVNGTVNAQGEDNNDQWHMTIINNNIIEEKGFSKSSPVPFEEE